LEEEAQGGCIFDGAPVNVAPSKLWEERFWIHAPAFATASAHEQTCLMPFWLTPRGSGTGEWWQSWYNQPAL